MSLFANLPQTEKLSSFSKSTMQSDETTVEDDFMYDSLCSLTSSKNKLKKQRKQKMSPALSLEEKKTLTFVLNECLSTNGKDPISISTDKLGAKRIMYNKTINSIGTSLTNCDISDNISIDIEAESTYLPLMCKLMIIVEGAAYERGKRLLLNDSAIQAGEGDLIKLTAPVGHDIPIIIESSTKTHLIRKQANDNSLMKIRSNENINYNEYNEQMDHLAMQRRHNSNYERNLRSGGSLTNISSTTSSTAENYSPYYFTKKIDDFNHEFYEYISTPFYGYQRKNYDKVDFSNDIQEEFTTTNTNTKNTEKTAQTFQETVEIHIPIQLQVPEEYQLVPMVQRSSSEEYEQDRFHNEKQIMLDQNPNDYFTLTGFREQQDLNGEFINQLASFRMLSNNMRQYFNQRLSKFETDFDLNFFKEDDIDYDTVEFQIPTESKVIEIEHNTVPHHIIRVEHSDADCNMNMIKNDCIFHNYQVNSESNNLHNVHQRFQAVQMNGTSRQRKSSVTNLMYMRVVDGNIITSI